VSQDNSSRVFNVLFVCTGNACRSIMAEAIMNRAGRGRFRAFSAGPEPAGEIDPHALDLLRQMHHDTSALRPKSSEEFSRVKKPAAPDLDFVFTVCDAAAAKMPPPWAGQPMTAHWGLSDPAAVEGRGPEVAVAFGEAYRMLNNRITLFMNLPMASLDHLALQKRLEAIGGASGTPVPPDEAQPRFRSAPARS
jgi:protein-tyrosine-phosphatase